MYIVGIDPGVNGYVCIVHERDTGNKDLRDWQSFKMPVKKDEDRKVVDVNTLIKELQGKPLRVFLEQPFLLRQQGLKGLMTIGENYGRLLASLEVLEAAYATVAPSRWQTFLLNKAGLEKDKKLGSKIMALECARKLFPEASILKEKKVHDGLVDAILMAKYGSYICS